MTEQEKENIGAKPVDRSRVARAVFNAAESMGISDRGRIEYYTTRLIERLEKPPTFSGMEDLTPKNYKMPLRLVTDDEIEAMVKEVLGVEETLLQQKKMAVDEDDEMEEAEQPAVEIITDKERAMTPEIKILNLKLTENAVKVLEKRYLKKDKDGEPIEKPAEMFRRVANAVAAAEEKYGAAAEVEIWADKFYNLMIGLEFLPNSPTLMNAGRELGQLSACFVLPVEDSIESIFDAVKNTALIHKSGGGTGFSFSRLRPEQDRVGSTGGVASGPVSFMRAFDVATDVIKQGGTRRGANMAILRVDHPDIEKFIVAKQEADVLTNFNLSVAVTDSFMRSVEEGKDYDLINPYNGEVGGTLSAKKVYSKLVELAWKTGDPGVVFIDKINKDNPTPKLGRIESTNPCGEQPLLPYESCNLGSINLSHMLKETEQEVEVDYKRIGEVVKIAVRFLDNVIDVNKFPLEAIKKMTLKTRKIGLGVMGFADILLRLGIPYNSQKALDSGEEIMSFIKREAQKASAELAEKRGVFPAYKGSIYSKKGGLKLRNASCTTIAPTGTLSLIAGCSSGIEPLFALSFTRNILDKTKMIEVNPYFENQAREGGYYSVEMMEKLAAGQHLEEMEEVPSEDKEVFVTAHSIAPHWHVKMQAAFQRHTDNAVSKTVNFPNEATKEDVDNVYRMAFTENLKGITIYRDGSKQDQPMTTGKSGQAEAPVVQVTPEPRKRSKVTTGITERVTTGCGKIYVTVNSDEQGICEVFSSLGKAGGCASAQLESICRLTSTALRSGVDVAVVARQLKGIRCPSIAWENGKSILSCADAIASVLEKHLRASSGDDQDQKTVQDYGLSKNVAGQCPECACILVYQEGCFICPGCGYTKC
jgi:ribonucleoside-diphosphate reductase alpha chain